MCVFTSVLLADPPVVGPPPAPELAAVDDIMKKVLEKYAIPGAVVGIMRDGELAFIRGYGYSDATRRRIVELDSQFRIASISKPITALAILHLVEQGRLTLDDRVFTILPPRVLVEDPRLYDITVRHLLEHRGGWDRDGTGYDPMFRDEEVARSVRKPLPVFCPDIIEHMMGRRLDFDPGARTAYSNFGYCVLGEVIEKTSGVRYDQYIRDNLLTPLGLTRTQLGASSEQAKAEYEVTYADYPGAPQVRSVLDGLGQDVPLPYGGFSQEAMKANGGWISTVSDMLRLIGAATGARHPAPLASLPSGFPGYIPPSDPGYRWDFRGSLPGTSAVVSAVNPTTGSKYSFIVLMNSRPQTGDGALLDEVTNALHGVVSKVTHWPTVDLFRSRFNPSRETVDMRVDATAGSNVKQVGVSVEGDSVHVDIRIEPPSPWLTAQMSGPLSIAPGVMELTVARGAPVGRHDAWITVSSPQAENQLQVLARIEVVPFTVSGRVMRGVRPAHGVTITFSAVRGRGSIPRSVTTDSDGMWTQTGFEWGTMYKATPSGLGREFHPAERSFAKPRSGLDFQVLPALQR